MTLSVLPEDCNGADIPSERKAASIQRKNCAAIYPSDVCKLPGGAVVSGMGAQPYHEDNHPMLCCKHEHEGHRIGSHQKHKRQASRRDEFLLITISLLTAAFIAAELVGGYLAHSLAIMTDAFHMISDLASFLISILAIHLARRLPSARYPFGYQRAEVLGALCSIAIIWVLTAFLVYLAAMRIVEQKYEVDADTMMIIAGVGVLFNIIIGALLHFVGGASHHHHHAHTHPARSASSTNDMTSTHGDDRNSSCSSTASGSGTSEHVEGMHPHANLNIRAAFVHVLGDLVQSVGVLLAAVIIKFTNFQLADPICTFLFGILVLMTTITVLKDALAVLMESAPAHVSTAGVVRDLMSIPGVSDVHSLRIWALKLDCTAIAVHLDIESALLGGGKAEDAVEIMGNIIAEAHRRLHSCHHIEFITVQVQCRLLAPRDSRETKGGEKDMCEAKPLGALAVEDAA